MDLDGSRLGVLRTSQRSWFEIKTQKGFGTSFVNHLGPKIKTEIVLGKINGVKIKNELNLLGFVTWLDPKWKEVLWGNFLI